MHTLASAIIAMHRPEPPFHTEDVTSPAQYGDGIAALAAYLQTLHCIPEKRLAQLILDTYGINISAVTLAKLIAKKAKAMEIFSDAVKDH